MPIKKCSTRNFDFPATYKKSRLVHIRVTSSWHVKIGLNRRASDQTCPCPGYLIHPAVGPVRTGPLPARTTTITIRLTGTGSGIRIPVYPEASGTIRIRLRQGGAQISPTPPLAQARLLPGRVTQRFYFFSAKNILARVSLECLERWRFFSSVFYFYML